ncbi:RluA family pseudouridine synthase [Lactococcus paracarnosus]|uniref:Pseudouridine synthase n=1 Tax=Pseudolactococcus paracarnosus TaxID=2749962 RepID=A0A7L4WC45_9LACT|nr:RluA family pseudouridine synthase [Lactococcus paracarnosus]SPC35744.1 pseudouridylate synthase [Lactococcus piscium]MCJ1976497.1 RluA family pseudouridine synthase [Lactococcus paracarnosus]MCJ1982714.1 RluA family pseudouridine synthase [Lactococcus paracarnosus]MCJ1994991.1 RluA family pseudouridine synthase [Lactococcus paracarnosus]MCJ1997672.1 RluA family pseudouridine synthase [Lactococcus paracarnosus]
MKIKIKATQVGSRLDKAISDASNVSRTQANDLIKADAVYVNGEVKKAKYKVLENDLVSFVIPEPEVLSYEAENIPLDIVYEDDDVAVINKPQGMVVHPSAGHHSGTLVNALMYHMTKLSSINGVIRPGIVHRIDKDTSGLLMVAKNDQAHELLAAQLKDHSSKRRYLAIIHGNLLNDRGVIEAPIGRNPKDRKKQAVIAGGKHALTHFEVLERFGEFTLVNLTLETGRTHQIRVHMAYIGHPVAGDPLYGPKNVLKPNHGQFLHAEILGFKHPTSQEWLEFEIEPPKLFKSTLEKLRVTD